MTMGKKSLIIIIVLMLLFVSGCTQKNKLAYIDFQKTHTTDNSSLGNDMKKSNVLRIGMVSRMGLEKDTFDYTPVCKMLEQELGLRFEIRWYKTSSELNEQLPFNSADVIITPASSLLWGMGQSNFETLAAGDPLKAARSVVIVPSQSDIQDIKDLYNENFAIVDPISNSEGLYFAYLMKTLKQNTDVFFRSYFNTYNNRNAIQLVAANKVAGAAVENIALEQLEKEDASLQNKIRVIYTGPQTKGLIVAAKKNMDPSLKAKVKTALLSMNENQDRAKQLNMINLKGFKPVNESAYKEISEVIRTVRNK